MHKLAFMPLALFLFLILGSLGSLVAKMDWGTAREALFSKEIQFALTLSVGASFSSLVLAVTIGIPAAWAMARHTFIGKRFINALLDLPMVTPPLVVGIGLLLLLGRNGAVGALCPFIADSLFSVTGVIIAQTYVACSIIVRSAIAALSSIDVQYVNTAYNLGLSPGKTFLLVEIPLCWRSLAGGVVVAFSRSLGEFGATLMLAGATRLKTETLPMAVYLNIASGDFSVAIGCAVLLIVIACVLLLLLHFLQRDRGFYADC